MSPKIILLTVAPPLPTNDAQCAILVNLANIACGEIALAIDLEKVLLGLCLVLEIAQDDVLAADEDFALRQFVIGRVAAFFPLSETNFAC